MKSRIAVILLLFFIFSNKVISQNFLMVESQQGFPDETNIFQILLINNDPVKAIQFDVELPNNFELDINNVAITDRTAGFNVAASYLSGTTYRIILFSTNNLLISPGDSSILTLPVLIDESVTPGVYLFNFSGVIISDATNQNISSTPLESGEIIIIVANSPSPIELCDETNNDGLSIFDLTIIEPEILGTQTDLTVTYYETQSGAETGVDAIANPTSYENQTNPQVLYPRLSDPSNNYFDTTQLTLTVLPVPSTNTPTPLEACDDNNDGLAAFMLTDKDVEILNGQDPLLFIVSYFEILSDAESNTGPLTSPYENTTPNTQTVFARLENSSSGCFGIVALILQIETTNPTITCPEDQEGSVDATCNFTLPDYTSLATAADNCTEVTVGQLPAPGTVVETGPTTIVLTVTDGASNTATCNFDVLVVDTISPTINCPADQSIVLETGNLYEVPDYWANGEASAIDNCTDPVTNFTQDPVAGTNLDFGTYVVLLTAEDEFGNMSSCSFELLIEEILNANDTELGSLILYPNPADNYVSLNNPNNLELFDVTVYDLMGRMIQKIDLSNMESEISIDVSAFENASYFMVIKTSQGTTNKQLIINN